ncbi:MAG: AAA family ATPase [bacterium]|nr:AAA family ATPase [bacterium]
MKKRFNYTGVCVPKKHYMVDLSDKVAQIFEMIEAGNYFTINRPRQYGKTTVIHTLERFLNTRDDYVPIRMSFESIGSESYKSEAAFIDDFLSKLKKAFQKPGGNQLLTFIENRSGLERISQLGMWITELVKQIDRKTVLMIDEVDKSSNNQLFLDFLGMLRDKYLEYDEEDHSTFHSVILAGVHDIKHLKTKIRPDEEAKYNSPWNIADDFEVDLSLSPVEIASMLKDYVNDTGVKINIPLFSEKLFYYTSGYPFLVSFLCHIIDKKILPEKEKKEWELEDLEKAVQITLFTDNTNFGSLITKLKNNQELYDMVFDLIINGHEISFNPDHTVIGLGKLYGILTRAEGNKAKIHNRLYEQRIYNYMSSNLEISRNSLFRGVSSSYIQPDGSLNIEKAIQKFQDFMKEQYSSRDIDFIERNGRLLFLAFIKPIINGKGFDFKEVQISEEKRLDVVITYNNIKYIVELKIWRGDVYHQEGIKQLYDYLDRQNLETGYLLIYDLKKEQNKMGHTEPIHVDGKKIIAAWV